MRNVNGRNNLIILDREELEKIKETEYQRGYADGAAAAEKKAQSAVSRSKAKVKTESGEAVEYRATVEAADKDD